MEIKVLKDILNANNQLAEQNRRLLLGKNIMTINLMSSPGAGKTTLILRTIEVLQGKARIGVIEGDISSSIDSKKISQAEVPVIQINTGGDCHLDASMVKSALTGLPLDSIDILFIENVGNLICPAGFDLGEYQKVIILSAPEGDDKPYKYPSLFTIAEALLVNKIDLLPYINFDMGSFQRAIKGLNQKATIFEISGTTGQGIGEWGSWVMEQLKKLRSEKERAS